MQMIQKSDRSPERTALRVKNLYHCGFTPPPNNHGCKIRRIHGRWWMLDSIVVDEVSMCLIHSLDGSNLH